jgi:hypothetical protein
MNHIELLLDADLQRRKLVNMSIIMLAYITVYGGTDGLVGTPLRC